jgi:integral membrane protein (TIGR01906 family)
MGGAADRLGTTSAVATALSDRSIEELVLGAGDFAFDGPDGAPFYDADERGHLRDARLLLWLCLGAGGVSALLLGLLLTRADDERRRALWAVVALAGATTAIAVIAIGIVSVVAFSEVFTLFHRVFFPAGNWSFDPATQRLVQLYPFSFWQVASAAFGALVLVLGVATGWVGRRLARSRSGRAPWTGRV